MPGPPAITKSGSGCLRRLMAGTRAKATPIWRPPGLAGFSGTVRTPQSADTTLSFWGCSSWQGDSRGASEVGAADAPGAAATAADAAGAFEVAAGGREVM